MRTSKGAVNGIFEVFVKMVGGRVATSYKDVGAYRLDYAAEYGGYNIERITSAGGAVSHPFGSDRRSASEMWSTLYFAVNVVDHIQKEKVS